MSGKGSARRPGIIPPDAWNRIFNAKPQTLCGQCRKPVDKCGCCPTEDGPGQGSDEVKTHYERRRFDREGV